MAISEGDTLPAGTLTHMTADGPAPVATADYFAGRTVALFAVPGAYTPTCSAKHLPGFVEQADALKAAGVDEIACMSVNDVFVMAAWGKDAGAGGKVTMLADGNADFARALGLAIDLSQFGMGERAQRFSMLVRDGVVDKLFIDAGGTFELSSAEHMLKAL